MARDIGFAALRAGDGVVDAFCADVDAAAAALTFGGKMQHQPVVLRFDVSDVRRAGAAGERDQGWDERWFHFQAAFCLLILTQS